MWFFVGTARLGKQQCANIYVVDVSREERRPSAIGMEASMGSLKGANEMKQGSGVWSCNGL